MDRALGLLDLFLLFSIIVFTVIITKSIIISFIASFSFLFLWAPINKSLADNYLWVANLTPNTLIVESPKIVNGIGICEKEFEIKIQNKNMTCVKKILYKSERE